MKTTKNALTIPRRAVFISEEGPVVYRRGAFSVDAVPVKLGKENEDSVQVIEGLSSRDRILLAKEQEEEEKKS